MTMINTTRMLSLTAALATAAAIGIFTQSNPASASTGILQCEGNSRLKVIDCCQKIYNKRRPIWMMNSHASCHEVVKCKGGISLTHAGAVRKCWVQRIDFMPNSKKEPAQQEAKQRDPAAEPKLH